MTAIRGNSQIKDNTIFPDQISATNSPANGNSLVFNNGEFSWTSISGIGGQSNFLDLDDTPNSYGGQQGKFVQVNVAETGLVFTSSSTGTHNSLSGLQGGTGNEYYHLTNTEHSALVGGNITTIHSHALTSGNSNVIYNNTNSFNNVLTSGDITVQTALETLDTYARNANEIWGTAIDNSVPVSGQVLTFDGTVWSPADASGGSGFIEIGSFTVSGTTATYSGIPNTYRHLLIKGIGKSTKNSSAFEDAIVYFNNDTTTTNYKYSARFVYGTGSAGALGGNDGLLLNMPSAQVSPSQRGCTVDVRIDFYTNTTFYKYAYGSTKAYRSDVGQILIDGLSEWANTAAISRIDIILKDGNSWETGTEFILYGSD
jgi:hypothetical protein